MSLKLIVLLFMGALTFQSCDSANILCIFPIPSFSHQMIPRTLMKALGNRGHNITFFTTDPFETNLPNVVQHSWKSMYEVWNSHVNFAEMKESETNNRKMLAEFMRVIVHMTDLEMQDPAMLALFNSDRKFDVVIVEALGVTPFYAFSKYFNAPLIGITTLDAPMYTHEAVGNFIHPIIYPNFFLPYDKGMSFVQRVETIFFDLYFRWYMTRVLAKDYNKIIEKNFGQQMAKSEELIQDLDFLMYNSHPLLGAVRPTVPASLALGFLHIEPPKPLPKDLEEFFKKSKNGVIYFSLGSNVKSKDLGKQTVQTLCEVFRKLDYDILWKWETEVLEGKPNNVKISKWLPQHDVLAQKKVKLFITQGGQQSFEEAIHYGVPVLVFPFLADQSLNAQRAVRQKVGLMLDINTVTAKELERSLNDLLNDKNYKQNMNKMSDMAKDQPMTSLESAVWWTEYVIRNKGAKHLHGKDKDLPFYQYYFLDMVATGLVVLCLLCFLIKVTASLFGAKSKKTTPKTDKRKIN